LRPSASVILAIPTPDRDVLKLFVAATHIRD